MENQAVDAVALAGSVAAADFSLWGLFLKADILVKGVMVVLVLASFWCWAIIFEKIWRLRKLDASASQFEDLFWSGVTLDELHERIGSNPSDPMSAVFIAAMSERRRSIDSGLGQSSSSLGNLHQRIDRVMQVSLGREMAQLERYMTFLASVGSTAPFVGLFGTVYGIMNSFQSIAMTKQTSLAVVAPGIAEALFATALGLVAAIPAVIAYNKISTDLGRYANRLESFAGEFSAILSRQFEEA